GIRDGHVTGVQTCALPILVLDVGWAYYVGKKAQSAVDAAATAAISTALDNTGSGGPACGGHIGCQTSGSCPADGNLHVACQYARSEERRVGKECGFRWVCE